MAGLLMLLDLDASFPLILILTSSTLLLPLLQATSQVPAAALSKKASPSEAAAAAYLGSWNLPGLIASIPGVAIMASVLLHSLMQSAYFLGLLTLDLVLAACLQMQLGATLWSPSMQQQLTEDSASCSRQRPSPSSSSSNSGHALPQMLNMCMRLLPKAITASLPLLAGVTQVVASSDALVTPVSSAGDALLIMLAMAWSSSLYQVPLAIQLPLSLVEWLLLYYAHGAPFTSGAARLSRAASPHSSILLHIWYSVLAVLISTVASKSTLVNSLRTSVMSGMTQLLAGTGMLSSVHLSSPSGSTAAAAAAAGGGGDQGHRAGQRASLSSDSSADHSYSDSCEDARGSLEKYKSCSTAQFDDDIDSWRCGAGRCGSNSSRSTAETSGRADTLHTPAISSSRSLSSKLSLGQASSGTAEAVPGAAGAEGPTPAAAASDAAQLAPAGSDVLLHGSGATTGVSSGTWVTGHAPAQAWKTEAQGAMYREVDEVASGLVMQRSSSASSILSFDATALAAMAAGQHGPSTPRATSAGDSSHSTFHATGGSHHPPKASAAERFLQSLVNTCGPSSNTTTTTPTPTATTAAAPAAAGGMHRRYMSQPTPAATAAPHWGVGAGDRVFTDDSAFTPPMACMPAGSTPPAAATSSSMAGVATVPAADLMAAAAGHGSGTLHPAATAAGGQGATHSSPQQVMADLSATFHPSPAPAAVPWSTLARHPVTHTPGYTGYTAASSGMHPTGPASSHGGSSSSSSSSSANNAAAAAAAAAGVAQRHVAGRSAALRAVAVTMGEEFASSLAGLSDAALTQLTSGGTVKERLLMPYTPVTQVQPVGCKVYSPGSYGFDTISHLLTTSLHHSAAAATAGRAYITSTCVSGCVQLLGAVLSPIAASGGAAEVASPAAAAPNSSMQQAAAGGVMTRHQAAWLVSFENAVTAGVGNWADLDQLPPPEVILQQVGPSSQPRSQHQQHQQMVQQRMALKPASGDAARSGAVAQLHGSFPCCLAAGQDQLVTLVVSIDPQHLAMLHKRQAASHARLQSVAAARVAAVANPDAAPSAAAEAAAKAAAPLLASSSRAAVATSHATTTTSSSNGGMVCKAATGASTCGVEWRMVVHQAGAAVLDMEVGLEEGSAGLQAIRLPLPPLSSGAVTISLLAGQSHVAVTTILPVLPSTAAEEVNATWQQLSQFDSALYPAAVASNTTVSSKGAQAPAAVWREVMAPFMQDVAYTAGQLSSGNTAATAGVLQTVIQGAARLGCWQLVEYLVNQHQRYRAAAEDTFDRTISSEQDNTGAARLQRSQFAAERSSSSFTNSSGSSRGGRALSAATLATIVASSRSSSEGCTSPFAAYAHQGVGFGPMEGSQSDRTPSSSSLCLLHGVAAVASDDPQISGSIVSDPSSSLGKQRGRYSNSSSRGQRESPRWRRHSSGSIGIGTLGLLVSSGGSREVSSSLCLITSRSSSATSSSDQAWRIPVKASPSLQLQRSSSVGSGVSVRLSKLTKAGAVAAAAATTTTAAAGWACSAWVGVGSAKAAVTGSAIKGGISGSVAATPQQRLLLETFLLLQFASTTVMCFQQQLTHVGTPASPGDDPHTSSSDVSSALMRTMAGLLMLWPPAVLLGARPWLTPALQKVTTAACVAAGPLVMLLQPPNGPLQTAAAVVQFGAAAPLILQAPFRLAATLLVVELVALCIGAWAMGHQPAALEAAVAGAAATAATALLFTLHAQRVTAAAAAAAAGLGGVVRAGV